MKPDDLLDYSLGQLQGHPLAVFEAELGRDPDLAARSEQLTAMLRLMLDDGDPHEMPVGLASRTVAFVADQKSKPAILDFVPRRLPFRWADVAVAAGILVAGLLTLSPAIKSSREQMNQVACANNLRQLGTSLANYAIRHDHYPKVVGSGGVLPVGYYAEALQGDKLLDDPKTLHCPCKGDCPTDTLRMNPRHMDFGYNVGYVAQSGRSEPISPDSPVSVPLLADQPPHDGKGRILEGNSPNHGRRGQNVLFSNLSVRWLPTRDLGPHDHDLFLNNRQQPEPGVSVFDSAVIPANFHVEATH